MERGVLVSKAEAIIPKGTSGEAIVLRGIPGETIVLRGMPGEVIGGVDDSSLLPKWFCALSEYCL
jgi:hypothetical protein